MHTHNVPTEALRQRLGEIDTARRALNAQAAAIIARLSARGAPIHAPEPDWLATAHRNRAAIDRRPTNHVTHRDRAGRWAR